MEATFIRDVKPATGQMKLYKLSEPYDVRDYDGDVEQTIEYIVVSATVAPFSGPETYIFPADESGTIVDWGELPGSMRGTLSHDAALSAFLSQ